VKALKTALVIGGLIFAGFGAAQGWAQDVRDGRFARLHLWVATSSAAGPRSALIRNLAGWGFGDDHHTYIIFGYLTKTYPRASNQVGLDLKVEYSVTRKIAVGLTVSSFAKANGKGYDFLGTLDDEYEYEMGNILHVDVRATAYLLSASYMPALSAGRRLAARAGLGVGIADVRLNFETNIENKTVEGKPLCGLLFAGLDCRVFSLLTLGLNVQYRYIPYDVGEVVISAQYTDYYAGQPAVKAYTLSSASFGLGGLALGFGLGLHF
jgi:hypothetical protein